jgi:cyanate permease
MREFLRFLVEHENWIRRLDACILAFGLVVIFALKPGGWSEQTIRVLTGLAAIVMYSYWIADETRKANKHPRSARVQKIENYLALALWLLIGIFTFAMLVVFPSFKK